MNGFEQWVEGLLALEGKTIETAGVKELYRAVSKAAVAGLQKAWQAERPGKEPAIFPPSFWWEGSYTAT